MVTSKIVMLTCLGHVEGKRLLDGRTGDGSVGLTNNSGSSGTSWRRTDHGNNVWTLECLGDTPGDRFLDGVAESGTVHLAPHVRPPFTGTRWRANRVGLGERFTLECLGTGSEDRRFLDGNTGQGTVALAPSTDAPFTGTLWQVGVRID